VEGGGGVLGKAFHDEVGDRLVLHVGEVPCGAEKHTEKHTGRMQSARAGDGPRQRGRGKVWVQRSGG
jgi:hypothetical protein